MAQLRNSRVIAAVVMTAVLIIAIPLLFKKMPAEFRSLTMPHWPFSPTQEQFNPGSNQAFISPAEAWVLQVADFKLKENVAANALMQSLRQKGSKTYMRQVILSTGPVLRVFVGPEIKPAKLKSLGELLSKETQLKPMMTAFDPLLF
ncbi:SPOR domain-containing protein [Rickettsiella endosymbiont of Dermanyssus gallinae]|uniref:SPOR domain-containing protein n=1 Tax=Rickettsiella endosymbiont of Dermanyssus gallinae TaxID=2856608 RepID=UPI001C52DD48|nr:SPOR domain-containing protein [Rickettsiella endosymbiont of Dermanyssus gallinae]